MADEIRDIYIGEVKNHIKNGYGVYKFRNKFYQYEGDWKDGKKHGHGRLVMADGSFYQGTFANGEITGRGEKHSVTQHSRYSGDFLNGEYHGQGIIEYEDGSRYEGEWQRNQFHGAGIFMFANGEVYNGEFHCHKRHGFGSMKYKNGDFYEGDWIRGKRQGHGRLNLTDGSVYEGQFFADNFHGQGRISHCSGIVYEGLWHCGDPVSRAGRLIVSNHLDGIVHVNQGEPFTLEVEVLNEDGQIMHVESGRSLRVTAGFQNFKPADSSSIFHHIEDFEENVMETPFGYAALEFPLTDATAYAAFLARQSTDERQDERQDEQQDERQDEQQDERQDASHEGQSLQSRAEKSFALDSSNQEGLDFRADSPQPAAVTCVATDEGRATFADLLLPRAHSLYRPFAVLDERDGAASPKSTPTPANKKKKTKDREDELKSRQKRLGDERFARPGEYVICVQDSSAPSFTSPAPQPAFLKVLLSTVPQARETKDTKEKEKRKQWNTQAMIASAVAQSSTQQAVSDLQQFNTQSASQLQEQQRNQ